MNLPTPTCTFRRDARYARFAPRENTGWAAYYRGVVSSRLFDSLDAYMWKLLYKWSAWSHPNKPKDWIVGRYFGKHNRFRNDRWVFGAPGTSAYVTKFAWTGIVRHIMVKGAASPDDPALAEYWAKRRTKVKPPLDRYTLRLLTRQNARCPLCGDHLLTAEQPPSPRKHGNAGGCSSPAGRSLPTTSPITGNPGHRTMTRPASYTPPATAGTSPASAGDQCFNQPRPSGLPEPCAAMSGTHGSEGGIGFAQSSGEPKGR